MDLNSCAANSRRSQLSNARGFKTTFCTITDISWLERAQFFEFCDFTAPFEKILKFGKLCIFISRYTHNRERFWFESLCVGKLGPWAFLRTRIRMYIMQTLPPQAQIRTHHSHYFFWVLHNPSSGQCYVEPNGVYYFFSAQFFPQTNTLSLRQG